MQFFDDRLPMRFWDKVQPCPISGCWIWVASVGIGGYAQFNVVIDHQKRPRGGHRIAYEALVGNIPNGLHLDHLCRVRSCVNPEHLEAVTPLENFRRGIGALVNARKTHCPKGHEYSERNTITIPHPYGGQGRACRICKNARAVEKRALEKSA